MLRRARGYKYLLMELGADLLAVAGGLATAYWVRFFSGVIPLRHDWNPADYLQLYPIGIALWLVSLRLTHCYRNHPTVVSFNIARRLLKGSLLAAALIVVLNHFSRMAEFSRLLYPISLFVVLGYLVLFRFLLQLFIIRLLREGIARSRVLVVGTGSLARRLVSRCRMHPEYGYEAVGYVSDSAAEVGRTLDGVEVVGTAPELRELIHRHGAHEVFVTHSSLPPEDYLRLALESEQEVAHIRIVPNMVEMMTGDVYYDELAGIPLFALKETPLRGWNAFFKRLFDWVVSFVLLFFTSPIALWISWRIRRDSPGPVFYRQKRMGIDGREFEILKFRTMRVDAEKNGPVWSGRVDDRCTPFGRRLRRCDLDELPQLWNVLRGDMSLVGPRPERPEFVTQFKEMYPRYMGRHRVRAGMTGWAQVHGLRGDTPIDMRLQYDLYYIENWSFWMDLKILILTLLRRGAGPTAGHPAGATTPFPRPASTPAPETPAKTAPGKN